MATSTPTPSPRDGLDTGSIGELCSDGREVDLEVHAPRPWPAGHHDVVVPDDASALLEGLGAYGS